MHRLLHTPLAHSLWMTQACRRRVPPVTALRALATDDNLSFDRTLDEHRRSRSQPSYLSDLGVPAGDPPYPHRVGGSRGFT
jgi:hypothetical protein